jgi:hypothetical protein
MQCVIVRKLLFYKIAYKKKYYYSNFFLFLNKWIFTFIECFDTCATCKSPDKCDLCHKGSNREGGKNK